MLKTLFYAFCILVSCLSHSAPVGFFDHIADNSGDFLHILGLSLPVYMVFKSEILGINVFHHITSLSFLIFLISRASTKAWNLVRS